MSAHPLEMNVCLCYSECSRLMDAGLIEIRVGTPVDDEDKRVSWAEVWTQGELVHRSVHVHAKRALFALSQASQVN